MWKIFIEYDDKSKITLTGKHKDIPLRLALKYNLLYANSQSCIGAKYQRYPKKNYPEMDLMALFFPLVPFVVFLDWIVRKLWR